MIDYPSINWWKNNLRYHESFLSFASRFIFLNSINLAKFEDFFGVNFYNYNESSDATVEKISRLLSEDKNLVTSVLSPFFYSLKLGGNSFVIREDTRNIRFCEACASYGYHSYLHEIEWIDSCPFHLQKIKIIPILRTKSSTSLMQAKMEKFSKIMSDHSNSWPLISKNDFFPDKNNNYIFFEKWLRSVNKIYLESFDDLLMDLKTHHYDEAIESSIIGILSSIIKPPCSIERIFAKEVKRWTIKYYIFDNLVKQELLRVNKTISIDSAFEFYKYVKILAVNLTATANFPKFFHKCKEVQSILIKRHGSCNCKWALVPASYGNRWIEINPRERPYATIACPYEDAINDLERNWGEYKNVVSRKYSEDKYHYFFLLSRIFENLYLSKVPDNPINKSEYSIKWAFEWIDESPLTKIFNLMAELEIESEFQKKLAWLDSIDNGGDPGDLKNINYGYLKLRELSNEVVLISCLKN